MFLFLVNSSGAVALFCYLLIAVSELRMRRRLEREAPERLTLRMWLFPWLTLFAIGAIVVVIGAMALVDDVQGQRIPSFLSLGIVLGAAWLRGRRGTAGEQRRREGAGLAGGPGGAASGSARAGPARPPRARRARARP